jgi:psp operon transcriptional activator
LEVQEKILRVVEYGTYERVGSSVTHETNVRIIGATNADLPTLCEQGKFKEDLLDRLSFEVLFLPPLRERGEDIILLATYFASKMTLECGRKEMPSFSEDVISQMLCYPWPGNVRELKNVVERAVYRSDASLIEHLEFNPFDNPFKRTSQQQPVLPLQEAELDLSQFEAARLELDLKYLKQALKNASGNQKEAAKLLNLTYDQLRGLYRKYQDRLQEEEQDIK